MYQVSSSVVDLRKTPTHSSTNYFQDRDQLTQLLLGERVYLIEQNGDWAFVEALDQPQRQSDGSWSGYRGWLPSSSIIENSTEPNLIVNSLFDTFSFGTKLKGIEEHATTWTIELPSKEKTTISKNVVEQIETPISWKALIEMGKQFIGSPYHWGGLSGYNKEAKYPLTSVDCSGLVHLLYRQKGVTIPRDACDQILVGKPLSSLCEMEPGDLLFTSEKISPEKIDHVMLSIGDDQFLEAAMRNGSVTVTSLDEVHSLGLNLFPYRL